MATRSKIQVILSGAGVIGGGVSTFYTSTGDEDALLSALEDFYGVVAASSPDDVTFSFPNEGVTINDATGDVNGAWTGTVSITPFAGAANTGFQMGVGARVRWSTNGFRNGRQVIGTTFLAPLASSAYTTTGFLASANSAALDVAAEALIVAAPLYIVSRPSVALPTGASNIVIGAAVPLNVSWLRSRRT